MKKEDCPLCKREKIKAPWLHITICKKCDRPLIVSSKHKKKFSDEEKDLIKRIFKGYEIRYKKRSIPNHAHAHLKQKLPSFGI